MWIIKIGRHIFLMVVGTLLFSVICAQTREVNFDSLFPSTPYKNVFDSCMHLYGDLEVWVDCLAENRDAHVQLMCAELLVGKLVHVQYCVGVMLKKQPQVAHEDCEYLLVVVEQLQKLASQVTIGLPPERANQVDTLFVALQKDVEKLKTP